MYVILHVHLCIAWLYHFILYESYEKDFIICIYLLSLLIVAIYK